MISGILLAAGESRRMGRPKLLLPWENSTVIAHVVSRYLTAHLSELLVVVGAEGENIRRALSSKPVLVVENPDFREGMGSSLRRGVEAAAADSEGYLIGLGDQPFITSEIIDQLITSFLKLRPGIAVCSHQGKFGHPVIFGRKFRRDLCALRGDVGGRKIISEHPVEVACIEVGSGAIFLDIDTPADYPYQGI
jgi:molybdenum cofactor cytidylyltransferase